MKISFAAGFMYSASPKDEVDRPGPSTESNTRSLNSTKSNQAPTRTPC